MSEELVRIDHSNGIFLAPAVKIEQAVEAYNTFNLFVKRILKEGVDYGRVPGVSKPVLLKPGAEKMLRFFGLFINVESVVVIEDWLGKEHGGEPFFYYKYKAEALRNGFVVAVAYGSCNSWEGKYRWRTAETACPSCGHALRKDKNTGGWYCWTKEGGCGANYAANDERISVQPVGKVLNPDPYTLVNTVDKVAQKRAVIAVSLLACNASAYFTQDLEGYADVEVDADIEEIEPVQRKTVEPAPKKAQPKAETQAKAEIQRPLEPEKLREFILKVAARTEANKATDKDVQAVAACLDYVFLGDKDKRHRFIRWLTGGETESLKGMYSLAYALNRWLKPSYSSEQAAFIPTDIHAEFEANDAVAVLLLADENEQMQEQEEQSVSNEQTQEG